MKLFFGFIRAVASSLATMFDSKEEKLRAAVRRNDRNRHDQFQYSPSEYKQMYDPWNYLSEEEWKKVYRGERSLDMEAHGSPPRHHPVHTVRIFDGVSHLLDGEPTDVIDLDNLEYVRDAAAEEPADVNDSDNLEQLKEAAAQLADASAGEGKVEQVADAQEADTAEKSEAVSETGSENDGESSESDQDAPGQDGFAAPSDYGFSSDWECDDGFD